MNNEGKISISEMGAECAGILAEIYRVSFAGLPEQKWSKSDFENLMVIPGTKGIVISCDGEPIGFSLVRKIVDEAEIITFCILPNWCNNGYATVLLEWIRKRLQTQSFKRLFLEVRENNEAAIRLYKKCSFKIIGRRKGYYNSSHGEKTDALVMQNELNE